MKIRLKPAPLWWLHPVPAFLIALLPFVLCGELLPAPDFSELWHTEKHIDLGADMLILAITASFVAGAILQRLSSKSIPDTPAEPNLNYARLHRLFLATFTLTVLGYIFWAVVCYTHGVGPAQVLAILQGDPGASYAVRELGTTVPGLTTSTQFGMAAGIFGAILWTRNRSRSVALMLIFLVLMAVFRALIWSERLATIEVLIPLLVSVLGRRNWDASPRLRRLLYLAPIVGCVFLYVYFTASESVRSWGHYADAGGSLWYFSWARLSGYYITALNNGAMMYKTLGVLPFPYTIFEPFWRFPGMSELLPYNDLFSVDPYAYVDSLKSMANPEFNNPSGVFPYILDFGRIGACAFFFAVGWIARGAYCSFMRGSLIGVLCYPMLYISFLEISRIPYLTSARTSPSWAILFLGCFLLKQRRYYNRRPSKLRRRIDPQPIDQPIPGL